MQPSMQKVPGIVFSILEMAYSRAFALHSESVPWWMIFQPLWIMLSS